MSFFRRKPAKPVPKLPDLYVARDWSDSALRFFFTEELWQESTIEKTSEGSVRITHYPIGSATKELVEAIQAKTGARINSHRQYLALHWGLGNHPPDEAEQTVTDMLAAHFGWADPMIEHFEYGSARMYEVERLRGIRGGPAT